jgi:hypothetical protein
MFSFADAEVFGTIISVELVFLYKLFIGRMLRDYRPLFYTP